MANIRQLTADEARAMIDDPVVLRIAEFLWQTYGYTDEHTREYVDAPNGDGQWNFCVDDAIGLARLFNEMLEERLSS